MLHWSQDASTGWTRTSWAESMTKRNSMPFPGARLGARGRPDRRGRTGRIYHRASKGCKAQDRATRVDLLQVQVDAGQRCSYAPGGDGLARPRLTRLEARTA